ncbi:MAG TPA: sulfurtransferase [Chthoniobacterales bacterium]|nr:sulfurtransferase [Chthoniobacterales bacterium]
MSVITNIAAYKFAALGDLKSLRERLIAQCRTWDLKGTILLSTEGINLFVAGGAAEIESLLAELRAVPGLEELAPKFSESDHQPFTRMLVRVKKEIIAFGIEGIDPVNRPSPKLPAATLKQWLDEGRPLTLLDTRNDYEVKLGTFQGALTLGIDHFRQFPGAVSELPAEMKQQPIVMFCTGGIRCEKAGPFMEREGFQNIFQLDGGILKYFEEVGGAHYDGECFVFDQRVGVDPALRETDSSQCFVCQTPLDVADQQDPRYVPGKSCPYCEEILAARMAENIGRRNEEIRLAATPLPGSQPYDNRRPLNVPAAFDGAPLIELLCGVFPQIPREEWLELCERGQFADEAGRALRPDETVRSGTRCYRLMPATVEPDVDARVRVVYEDEAIIVLAKPAPLPMHPCGRFNRNTLQFLLNTVYAPQKPRPAHRLDANTTGLVVCGRSRHFTALLQPQFERGEVVKTYLAEVHGSPVEDTFVCEARIGTEPTGPGARQIDPENGQAARTEFRVLQRNDDGTTLLEVRPLTGRTNQIRIHLWQLGLPICGDPAYLPDSRLGESMTLPVGASPLRLHAWKLEFRHPVKGSQLTFEAEMPDWVRHHAGLGAGASL